MSAAQSIWKNPLLWLLMNAVVLLVYIAAAYQAVVGATMNDPFIQTAAIICVVHVLEVPLAFFLLKGQKASVFKVLIGTLALGFTWWVPARLRVYRAG